MRLRWLAAGIVLAVPGVLAADVPLIVPEAGRVHDRPSLRGYSFSILHEFTITGLAKTDGNANGVLDDLDPRLVGIWSDDSQELLASALIDQNSVLRDNMFVTPIKPLSLPAGKYTLAAQYFGDEEPVIISPNFETSFALIRDVVGREERDTAFSFPSRLGSLGFGPNLLLESPPIFVTQPSLNSVSQRRSDGSGSIRVEGLFDAALAGSVEVRAIPQNGTAGGPTAWQQVSTTEGSFAGELAVPSAGWYEIEARTLLAGEPVDSLTVPRVGIGEVFVIAGQSNSANHGDTRLIPQTADVLAMDADGFWRHAADPQPIATGSGGSPWPAFGDRVVEALDVPVGIVSVGWGGTSVGQWLPGAVGPSPSGPLYERLRGVLEQLGPDGVRAVLWHQGESDALAGTSRQDYATRLAELIAHSRADAGYDVPWGVAEAAFLPATSEQVEAAVRAGQRDVIAGDPLVFAGPLTDDLLGEEWRYDRVHFNEAGLRVHGERWADAVLAQIVPEPASSTLVVGSILVLAAGAGGSRRSARDRELS